MSLGALLPECCEEPGSGCTASCNAGALHFGEGVGRKGVAFAGGSLRCTILFPLLLGVVKSSSLSIKQPEGFLTLEIPDFGTLFRVPMSTVEYQIGHDQKIIFLPLEPQKV